MATDQDPQRPNQIVRWATIAFFVVMIGGFLMSVGTRNATQDNVRTGMETSQPSPLQPKAPPPDRGG